MNHRSMYIKRCTSSILIAAALGGTVTSAQADVTVPEGIKALEEVIVTAQKRTEKLQDVPLSIRALSAADLEKNTVVVLTDLKASLPGLDLAPYPGSGETLYPSIRSIQANSVSVATPIPMAVHINGVYISQIAGLNVAAADLERIELLKGPQGVLSGRNATGGALNLYTAKPLLGAFDFMQQVTVAERGQVLLKTNINAPMGETLAAKISYLNSRRDNEDVNNSAPGGVKFGQKKADAWRLDLRWRPTDKLTVDYGFDTALATSYDTPSQCLYAGNNVTYGGFIDAFMSDPRVAKYVAGCSTQKQSALYFPYAMPKNHNKIEGHTLSVEWLVDPSLTLRSITGYRKVDTRNNVAYSNYAGAADVRSDTGDFTVLPAGSSPFNGQSSQLALYNETWSQELQFLGNVNKNFHYTAGVYYSQDKGHQNLGPSIFLGIPSGAGPDSGMDAVLLNHLGISSARNSSLGVFGQFNWRPDILARKLEIVPGVRFSRDHRQAVGYSNNGEMYLVDSSSNTGGVASLVAGPLPSPLGAPYSDARGDRSFTNTSPQVSVNFHWNDDLMTYAKIAKAYTTGGFDVQAGTATQFTTGFAPETLTSTELGMKAEFFDHRLRTNVAAFHSKYVNQQQSVPTPTPGGAPVWIIQNVGGSTYNGVELDIAFAATSNLRFSLDAAWLHHRFNKFADLVSGLDAAHNRKLIVPKLSYSLNMDYSFPAFGLPGKLIGTLSYAHRDKSSVALDTSQPNAALFNTTPAIDILNGRLALSNIKVGSSGNHITVALWGKNLLNKDNLTFVYQNQAADSTGSWGEPRTFGIDMIYRYY